MPVYHVIIGLKNRPSKPIIKDNVLEKELLRDIVEPYNRGDDFRCDDEIVSRDDISNIKITESEKAVMGPLYRPSRQRHLADRWQAINQRKDVTDKFIKTPLPRKSKMNIKKSKVHSSNIFIVHGRDDKPKLELARILEKLGFKAIILSEQPDKGRTIIEKLEQETMDIGYAFVILTPDDVGGTLNGIKSAVEGMSEGYIDLEDVLGDELNYRARQNVILELGYFVGKIGRNRVCCLYKGDVKLPSDIHGVLFKKFDKSVEECYKGILDELKAAGYEIKM
jgi:predicted nucleotide-binding protein